MENIPCILAKKIMNKAPVIDIFFLSVYTQWTWIRAYEL